MDVLVTYQKIHPNLLFWKKEIPIPLLPKNYDTLHISSLEYLNADTELSWEALPPESKDFIVPVLTMEEMSRFQLKKSLLHHCIFGYLALRPGGQMFIELANEKMKKLLKQSIEDSGSPWKYEFQKGVTPFTLEGQLPHTASYCLLQKPMRYLKKPTSYTKRRREARKKTSKTSKTVSKN